MLEAKMEKALVLKQVLDAIKELVTDVNFDCDEDGIKSQAMDNSHVALVALLLRTNGFSQFRCDRNISLGINVGSLQKIVKCAGNDDIVTIRAQDEADVLNLTFDTLNSDRVADYDMKMMDIDIEHLSIPVTTYDAEISMPAAEFSRIVRDLKELGESVRIEATKEGIKFSCEGDIGKAAVTLKQTGHQKKLKVGNSSNTPMIVDDDDEENEAASNADEDEDDEAPKIKPEPDADDEEEDSKPKTDDEEEEGDSASDAADSGKGRQAKKRKLAQEKKKVANGKSAGDGKKGKKGNKKGEEKEEEDLGIYITLQQSVSLTFSIKYLSNFTKATPLANRVVLHMSNEVPLLVEYDFSIGYVRYYLAPKIEDD